MALERLAMLLELRGTDGVVRGLKDVERTADRSLGRTEDRIDRVGDSMTKIGAAALGAGVLAGAGLLKAAGAAADLNESINLTEQVFGDASDEIGQFAANAADSLGLSERAARDATAQFGLLLTNLGVNRDEVVDLSQNLTTLAADFASAFNTSTEDAVVAIGAALRGESEPIRRYGVFLDDAAVKAKAVELGLAATAAEVDNSGKAYARLAIIQEMSSAVQGDFARTADGAANAQRRLGAQLENFQASLGQAVLPVLEQFLEKGNDLLGWYNALEPEQQKFISQAALIGTTLLIAGGAVSTLIGALIKMRTNLRLATSAMAAQRTKLVVAAAAAGAAVLVYRELTAQQRRVEAATDGMTRAIQDSNDTLAGTQQFIADTAEQSAGFADVLADAGLSVDQVAAALRLGDTEWEEFKDSAEAATLEADRSRLAWFLVHRELDTLRAAAENTDEHLEDLAETESRAAAAAATHEAQLDLTEAATDAYSDGVAAAVFVTDDLTDEVDDLTQSLSDLVTELIGSVAPLTDLELLIEDAREATGKLVDENGELTQSQARTFDENQRQIEQFAKLADEADETGASYQEVARFGSDLRDEWGRQQAAGAITVEMLELLNSWLDELERERRITITDTGSTVRLGGGGTTRGIDRGLPQFAQGGIVPGPIGQPQVAIVHGGEEVIPAGGRSGGGPIVVQLRNVIEVDGRVMAEVVAEHNLAAGGQLQ